MDTFIPTKAWRGLIATLMLIATGAACAADPIELRIGGTGNALGTMRQLAQSFAASAPRYRPVVLPSIGSSGAIRGVPKGAVHLGVSSRPPNEDEGRSGIVAMEYARAPTVFAVREQNPVNSISLREIADIYAGRMQQWPDGNTVRPVMRQPGDDNTQQIARLSPAIADALKNAEQRSGLSFASIDQEAADKMESIAGAFGVTTLALIRSENRKLKALAIDGVAPTPENAAAGRYPLQKHFYLILPKEPAPGVSELVAFIRSPAGRKILEKNGHTLP